MLKPFDQILGKLKASKSLTLSSAPGGFDALIVADLARRFAQEGEYYAAALVFVARDGQRQAQMEAALSFLAPDLDVLSFPNWDCQPYDRVSPHAGIVARRMTVLSRLARSKTGEDRPRVLILTANGLMQRVTARSKIASESFSAAPGNRVDTKALALWLESNGFMKTATVRETGEYAVRGGIIDLFPPGMPLPVRLDFFGDTLEYISFSMSGLIRFWIIYPMYRCFLIRLLKRQRMNVSH